MDNRPLVDRIAEIETWLAAREQKLAELRSERDAELAVFDQTIGESSQRIRNLGAAREHQRQMSETYKQQLLDSERRITNLDGQIWEWEQQQAQSEKNRRSVRRKWVQAIRDAKGGDERRKLRLLERLKRRVEHQRLRRASTKGDTDVEQSNDGVVDRPTTGALDSDQATG